MKKEILIIFCVLASIILWMFRFSTVPVVNGAYKVNRFTGEIVFLQGPNQYGLERK
jgi:hypothetical protein